MADLTEEFRAEIERSLHRIGEATGPYTRFVRSERQPDIEDAETAEEAEVAGNGDAPLALTPEMMSDEDEDDDESRAGGAVEFVSAPEAPADGGYAATAPVAAAVPGPSDAQIRQIVREVIREELSDGDAAGLVREIIKAELTTGEIGANISRNVLRLIRSEVAKSKG